MAVVDLYLVYEFIKRLATPFKEWEAYERGIIDEKGNILKDPKERRRNIKDRQAFGKFDLLVLKLKKLLEKIPGGQTRLGSYAAALWLVKEHVEKGNETLTEESLQEYMTLAEDLDINNKFENYLIESDKPPRWKRAGRDGEIEIKFPTGRKFKVEKFYDDSGRGAIRHRGEFAVYEWSSGSIDDWEIVDIFKPKGYAKQRVMMMGQYDSKGNKVADYSSTFQYESYQVDETMSVGAGVVDGIGYGPKGEPGLIPKQMNKYKKKNKKQALKRFKNMWS